VYRVRSLLVHAFAMEIDPSDVDSREGLVEFVGSLVREHRAEPARWENGDLESFLEALAGWINDSPGFWANRGEAEPSQPDWSGLHPR
jgi:hypothetical protein